MIFKLPCLLIVAVLVCTRALALPRHDAGVKDTRILEDKVEDLFRDVSSLPLSMTRQKGNIEVRTKFDGDSNMISVAEIKQVDHHPDSFRGFLEDFAKAFPQTNPMVRTVVSLEQSKDREALKSILKFPFPLSDRIMVHWKYLKLNRSPNEHMLIISERENEGILERHLTQEEKKNFVLARTFLCVYWIKPIHDENGKVVGSTVKYAFSGDTGGAIPALIQKAVGPKTALDSVRGLLKYVGLERSSLSTATKM